MWSSNYTDKTNFSSLQTKTMSESLSHTKWTTQSSKYKHIIHNRNVCPRLTCSSQEQHSPYYLTFFPLILCIRFKRQRKFPIPESMTEFLVTQWCGLHAFTAEDAGSIPGREAAIPQATQWGKKNQKNKKHHTTDSMSLFLLKFSAGSEQFPAIASKSRASTTNTHLLLLLAGPWAPPSNPGLSQSNF